jgi:hypothetical protein
MTDGYERIRKEMVVHTRDTDPAFPVGVGNPHETALSKNSLLSLILSSSIRTDSWCYISTIIIPCSKCKFVSFKSRLLYPKEISAGTQYTGGWPGPRDRSLVFAANRTSIPRPSSIFSAKLRVYLLYVAECTSI